jgi:hypothetical protein
MTRADAEHLARMQWITAHADDVPAEPEYVTASGRDVEPDEAPYKPQEPQRAVVPKGHYAGQPAPAKRAPVVQGPPVVVTDDDRTVTTGRFPPRDDAEQFLDRLVVAGFATRLHAAARRCHLVEELRKFCDALTACLETHH